MPALAVTLNGDPLVTVSSEGLSLVDVHVSGDRLVPELAILRVTGGYYEDGGAKTYLIWEEERHLDSGDEVLVSLLEGGHDSRAGQTIDQLYPENAPSDGQWQPEPIEEIVRELEQRPKLHDRFAFSVTLPSGDSTEGTTLPVEHGFAFHVSWVWLHPERARVSLHTYTLQSLIDQAGSRDHVRINLSAGESVKLRVGA